MSVNNNHKRFQKTMKKIMKALRFSLQNSRISRLIAVLSLNALIRKVPILIEKNVISLNNLSKKKKISENKIVTHQPK